MGYYSAAKRNEVWSFAVMCMDLASVIQSEVRKKQILYINTYTWNLEKLQMNISGRQEQRCRCKGLMWTGGNGGR